ncbi:hypothetical protein MJD09_05980 [bacterium]|nr:hypothetical protein [bacterium]
MKEPTEYQEIQASGSNDQAKEIRRELTILKNKGKTPEEVLKTLNDEISQLDALKGDITEYQTNADAIKTALTAYEAALPDLTKRQHSLIDYRATKDTMINAAIHEEVKTKVDEAKKDERGIIDGVAKRIGDLEAEVEKSGDPTSKADQDFNEAKSKFDSLTKRAEDVGAKFAELEKIRDAIEKAESDKEEANRYGVMYYYMNKFIQVIDTNEPKFFAKTEDLKKAMDAAWFDLVAKKNVKQKRSLALAKAQAELEQKQAELKSLQDNFDTAVLTEVRKVNGEKIEEKAEAA